METTEPVAPIPTVPNNPDDDKLTKLVCCVLDAATKVLTAAGLPVPERGGASHKGIDDECEDCTGMFATLGESRPAETDQLFAEDCSGMRVYDVELVIMRQVCTEAVDPCGTDYGECVRDEQGCPLADPVWASGPCPPEGKRPTVFQESSAFWRERRAIEREIAKAVKCCLEECLLGCRRPTLGVVTEETLGGCHYLTVQLSIAG